MSADRAEIIRDLIGDWNRGDVEAVVARGTDDFEWHPLVISSVEGEGEPYRGRDGFREFFDTWMATWDTWTLEVEELREYDNQVLTLTRVHAKGRGSGVELDRAMAHLWEFRGDRICRAQSFLERDDAVAAAERREQAA
jgi:ketosteroid isomerase-like protein